MNTAEYTEKALQTLRPDQTANERLSLCGLGMAGETGEIADLLKKYLHHRNGKPLSSEKIKDELGDVIWYAVVLADTLGFSLQDAMKANIAKLEARHPSGFVPNYGSDSGASEAEVKEVNA